VEEGQAFLTVLPSEHVYYLPKESSEWSFYWFTLAHPYVVERLARLLEHQAPVFPVPAASHLHSLGLSLFERCCQQRFEDRFAEEGALFEWMLGLEQHMYELAHPRNRRDALMEELRRYTLENLKRSFGIEELARRHGLSRSHYSHAFRSATGMAPAGCVSGVRLGEVRRLLRESGSPLKDIAAATGFADANHLCKAFRRLYHISPGLYRKGARGV
jgi:transcriptional regulator GlxA family with amidase domain